MHHNKWSRIDTSNVTSRNVYIKKGVTKESEKNPVTMFQIDDKRSMVKKNGTPFVETLIYKLIHDLNNLYTHHQVS